MSTNLGDFARGSTEDDSRLREPPTEFRECAKAVTRGRHPVQFGHNRRIRLNKEAARHTSLEGAGNCLNVRAQHVELFGTLEQSVERLIKEQAPSIILVFWRQFVELVDNKQVELR